MVTESFFVIIRLIMSMISSSIVLILGEVVKAAGLFLLTPPCVPPNQCHHRSHSSEKTETFRHFYILYHLPYKIGEIFRFLSSFLTLHRWTMSLPTSFSSRSSDHLSPLRDSSSLLTTFVSLCAVDFTLGIIVNRALLRARFFLTINFFEIPRDRVFVTSFGYGVLPCRWVYVVCDL